jgi:hypothetical protein
MSKTYAQTNSEMFHYGLSLFMLFSPEICNYVLFLTCLHKEMKEKNFIY